MRPVIMLLACAALVAVDVPAVPALPDDGTYAMLVIPDLRTALTHQEQAVGASGTPLPPGMLAMTLGSQLGDPGLQKLQPGPVVLAMGPGVPFPSWCAIIPVADPAMLQAVAGGAGLMAEAVPGGFAVGSVPGGIELAKLVAPAAAGLTADMSPDADLRLVVASNRLARDYLPFLLGMMQQGAMQAPHAPGQDPQRMLQIVSAILRTLSTQAGSSRIDIGASVAGWQLDVVAAPQAGHLANALQPVPAVGDDLGLRLGAGEGHPVMAVNGRFPPAIYAAMAELAMEAGKDPALHDLIDEKVVGLLRRLAAVTDGRVAMRQGAPGHPMRQLGVQGVTDAAAMRQLIDDGLTLMQGETVQGLMRDLGFTMTAERNVRQAGSVGIDRFSYTVDPSKLMPGQGQMLQAMLEPVEMAVASDVVVFGGPSSAIDGLLAGPVQAPLVLTSTALGAGWDIYADYDMLLMMRMQFEMMSAQMPGMPPMFADEQGGNPLQFAAAFGPGRARCHVLVPAPMVKSIWNGFRSQMRHNVRQRQPVEGPAATPPATPMF